MTALHWHKFNPNEFIGEVCGFDDACVAAYIRLRSVFWSRDCRPLALEDMPAIVGKSRTVFQRKIWPKIQTFFEFFEDGWIHAGLLSQHDKSLGIKQKRVAAGQAGGLAKARNRASKRYAPTELQNPDIKKDSPPPPPLTPARDSGVGVVVEGFEKMREDRFPGAPVLHDGAKLEREAAKLLEHGPPELILETMAVEMDKLAASGERAPTSLLFRWRTMAAAGRAAARRREPELLLPQDFEAQRQRRAEAAERLRFHHLQLFANFGRWQAPWGPAPAPDELAEVGLRVAYG